MANVSRGLCVTTGVTVPMMVVVPFSVMLGLSRLASASTSPSMKAARLESIKQMRAEAI